jgi:hypothetical protein
MTAAAVVVVPADPVAAEVVEGADGLDGEHSPDCCPPAPAPAPFLAAAVGEDGEFFPPGDAAGDSAAGA